MHVHRQSRVWGEGVVASIVSFIKVVSVCLFYGSLFSLSEKKGPKGDRVLSFDLIFKWLHSISGEAWYRNDPVVPLVNVSLAMLLHQGGHLTAQG